MKNGSFFNGADFLLPELWDGLCCFPKLTQEAAAVPASPHEPGPRDCVCRCCPTWKRAEDKANPAGLVSVICCFVSYELLAFRKESLSPKLSFRDVWGCTNRLDDLWRSSPPSGPHWD